MQKRIKVCGNLIHHTAPFSMTLNDPYAEKHGGALCRVKIHRRKPDLHYVNGSGKVNVHPHPDQHQKLNISRGSPLGHAYHVWSTPVTAIVSLLLTNDRLAGGTNENITPPTLAEL